MKKQKRNISGLRNQSLASATPSGASTGRSSGSPVSGLEQQTSSVPAESFQVLFDSTRVDWEKEDEGPTESDVDDEMGLDVWDDEVLAENLVAMVRKVDGDDDDWLPPRVRKEQSRRKGKCMNVKNLN